MTAVGIVGATGKVAAAAAGTTVTETPALTVPLPFVADRVNEYEPAVPDDGVPVRTPAVVRLRPTGKGPTVAKVGAGNPDAAKG
jgi:hypothetical protein